MGKWLRATINNRAKVVAEFFSHAELGGLTTHDIAFMLDCSTSSVQIWRTGKVVPTEKFMSKMREFLSAKPTQTRLEIEAPPAVVKVEPPAIEPPAAFEVAHAPGIDLELAAMQQIFTVVEPLDRDARGRVLGWAMSRYLLTQVSR